MKVQQSLTLQLEGEDIANLRALLRRLPVDVLPTVGVSGSCIPYVAGEICPDPQDVARLALRLSRAAQGLS